MIDLATEWVGMPLVSPLIVGASPLTDDLEALKSCEKAGAGAIVMHSLFEEQIIAEQLGAHHWIDSRIDSDAEARTFLPDSDVFGLGSETYLARLRKLKETLRIPVIASLNGDSPGGWVEMARDLESAGADAIELNLYEVVTDFSESAETVEKRQISVVRSVTGTVSIPVIVKISPFYSSLPGFVGDLEKAGARGVVLFNRFYQPDIDLDALDVSREIRLSSNAELPLRLHGCALLSGRTKMDIGITGGIENGDDAVKAILSGARIVQVVSELLRRGPGRLDEIQEEFRNRLSRMGYVSSNQARGVLSLERAPDPHAWERLNYAKLLKSWQPRPDFGRA